jgi:hypothetical protein
MTGRNRTFEIPRGRCLCGKTRFSFDRARATRPLICHCESCRRATSAPFAGFFTLPDTAWRWTGAAPGEFSSSPGVTRGFCTSCGSPMFYRTAQRPGETDFYAASLVDPADFTPEGSAFSEEALGWARDVAELPKLD